jgi:hypothetical protein
MIEFIFNQNGSWIEVSGAPANILVSKMGMPTVDDEETVKKTLLLNKRFKMAWQASRRKESHMAMAGIQKHCRS